MAYLAATLFYQAANFSAHPTFSTVVIVADLVAFFAVVLALHAIGKTRSGRLPGRASIGGGAVASATGQR